MPSSKKTIAFFLGVLISTALFSQAALKRANKDYELSNFANAIKSYKEVLEKTPDHLEANSKIADCYRLTNELDKALPHYQTAIAQGDVDNLYVFQYGLTLQGLGRYEVAQAVFERLANNASDYRTRALQFADACKYARESDEPALFKINNEFVNTEHSDFGVALYKNERIVYASARTDIRARDSRNAATKIPDGSNRLLMTQRDKNGFLETPVTLHSGFNNQVNEAPVAFSPDGRTVFITKNNFVSGIRQVPSAGMELTLYTAQADVNGDWTDALPFQHNGAGYSTGFPAFSNDGQALFFASDRPGGYGGYDLYVSYRTGSTWSAPENLGAAVNSLGNEISPFHDGASLYFASDYHKGFGGFDIFRAEESGNRWATLYHGGAGLNSSADDYGFVFDPLRNIGYFVSNRPGGKGKEDLYRVMKESDNVVIKVLDGGTGKPISDATVDFSDCGDRSYQTNANGVFNFQLMDNLNCTAQIRKSGYLSAPLRLSTIGLRQNKTLEVALTNENAAYTGVTVNSANGFLLEDVKVFATHQRTGEVTETTSSDKGEFAIALKPGAAYVLRFSKAGFRDVSVNLQTSEKDDKRLSNVGLLPVGASSSSNRPTTTGSTVKKDPTPPPSSAQPTTTNTSTAPLKVTIEGGYAVQIAASSAARVDLAPYQAKVGSEGTVYAVNESGKTKIRVGVFATRTEAEAAQKACKSSGYTGAFIVEETKREVTAAKPQTVPKKVEAEPAKPAATTAIESTKPPVVEKQEQLDGFLIRLATYGDLKNFDMSKVQDLGVIEKVAKGKMTVILLSGYDSKSSAEIALRKVRARGFTEAHLVMQESGEFKKVN